MEALSSTLERLKGLRTQLGISVEEMAEVAGVTPAKYTAVESGETDLSFTFLYKCAIRFGVDLADIVTGETPRLSGYALSRSGDGMPIKRREGFEYTHVAHLLKDRLAEPFVVTAKYSKTFENSPISLTSHGGQELNFVLDGTLKVQIDDNIEILQPGDSLFYNARKKHGMVALGGKDCKFLSVVIKGSESDSLAPVSDKNEKAGPGPHDKGIFKEYVNETIDENGMLQNITFNIPDNFNFAYDCVDRLADKSPDKLAMLWVSASGEEKRFTFGDMKKYSNKAANYFRRMGINKGDKVKLVLRQHYQFWFAITALHKLGAIAVPATDQLMVKDYEYRFDLAEIKAILCTGYGKAAEIADEAMKKYPLNIKMMANGKREGWDDFDAAIEKESDVFERVDTKADDILLMYFSSGTTGYPKIVQHAASYALEHIVTARWWHNVDPNGLHFTLADTGWAKSMWGKYYGQWLNEAAVFTRDFEKFSPIDILPMFEKYGITSFCAPPTMFRFFIKEDLSKYDLSSLKHASIAGEALNPEVYYQFLQATGLKLMDGFGQTESTLLVFNQVCAEPKPGSMGKPSPAYDVQLLDANNRPVKSGDVGEVCVMTGKRKNPGLFRGYYRDEKRTSEVWADNIYHTGDTAWQDEDGYLWYVGRTDDLIKSSGYRIGPFEIESVLYEMPCVLECAVIGVPDTTGERGQLVKATIVLAKGYSPSDELKREIQDYVKTNTAPYKYPRIVEFVETLPKTISGKIRRVEIREKS